MLKRKLLPVLLIGCVCLIFGQEENGSPDKGLMKFLENVNKQEIYDAGLPKEYTGSPYYLNDDFQPASIIVQDKNPVNLYLRYNVAKKKVELKINKVESQTYFLPANENVSYEINGNLLVWDMINTENGRQQTYFFKY